ncbi:MAG: hypothetical protein JSS83_27000 [Cyanobacteria bacterium SZAS LIN-3]|nr:hypothetical protein [Cyanobacteria bacterium SZAS LIN-3]MBS2009771.1 hypothetical protein [Cyanobacteria bacterium SZAS TMP-1]
MSSHTDSNAGNPGLGSGGADSVLARVQQEVQKVWGDQMPGAGGAGRAAGAMSDILQPIKAAAKLDGILPGLEIVDGKK